jgi:hypothetical protein
VKKIALCSGKTEVFLAGTEPYESCGNTRNNAALAPIPAPAVPKSPPTVPPDTVGNGEVFMRLDNGQTGRTPP